METLARCTSSVQGVGSDLHLTSLVEDCGDGEHRPPHCGKIQNFLCPHATVFDAHECNEAKWHLIGGRCNRWHCPGCGPLKTAILCRKIGDAKPNRFITLTTAHHETRSPREVWDAARRQVPELIRKIRREVGDIEYCRVLEEHKSGYPHFHLLVRSPYIEQKLLSRWWCELTDAFVVDIRKVDPERRVAKYVAKYLSKQVRCQFTDRRVTASKQFWLDDGKPPKPNYQWADMYFGKMHINDYVRWHYPDAELEWLSRSHAVVISRGSSNAPRAEFMRDRDGLPIRHELWDAGNDAF